jgi:NAD(P)-dependent dehydrogenase (short-subunit alcohol dehydrogenase family)
MSEFKNFDRLFRLDGKIALITGGRPSRSIMYNIFANNQPLGSRGLGLHAATAFLLAGASKVIITARKREGEQGIDQAVERLNKLPVSGKAIGIAANVAQTDAIENLVKQLKESVGQIDILVANAGATWGGPFEPTPDWSSQKVLDLNVRGIFNLVRL